MNPRTPIRAVSFDIWDTVLLDDSDEPKRARQGLPPKKIARGDLIERALAGAVPRERIDSACEAAEKESSRVWGEEAVTWTVSRRIGRILSALERALPERELSRLVREIEEMEFRVRPDLVDHIGEALRVLEGRYRLVVVSDTIFSPGWSLRKILEGYGLLGRFTGFVFSDEAGRSKPASEVFEKAAELASCRVGEMVHVGDREFNDVSGAKSAGAWAVLATAAKGGGAAQTRADAVCGDYRKLPEIIEALGERRRPR